MSKTNNTVQEKILDSKKDIDNKSKSKLELNPAPLDHTSSLSKKQSQDRLTAMRTWRALNARNYSFTKFKEIYGFDITVQNKKNRKALYQRLSKLEGPLTPEMRKFLTEELSSKNSSEVKKILTLKEKSIFHLLLAGSWQLTRYVYSNAEEKSVVLSPLEEVRRGSEPYPYSHASQKIDDISFKLELDAVNNHHYRNMIAADYHQLIKEADDCLIGLWSCDYFFSEKCRNRERHQSFNIFGTEYWVSYHIVIKKDQNNKKNLKEKVETDQVEYLKAYNFKHPDGTIVKQYVKMEEEIFLHPDLRVAFILSAIEKMRLLGRSAWEKLMQADLKTLQEVLEIFSYERKDTIHKPRFFPTNLPAVKIVKPLDTEDHLVTPQKILMNESLIKAALLGQSNSVMTHLQGKQNFNIHKAFSIEGESLSLLSASILGGQPILVDFLLKNFLRADYEERWFHISQGINNNTNMQSAIIQAISASKPGNVKVILQNIFKNEKISHDIKENIESYRIILKLLLDYSHRYRNHINIRLMNLLYHYNSFSKIIRTIFLSKPSPKIIEIMVPFFSKTKKSVHLRQEPPLFLGVFLQSPELVKAMIEQGANINRPSYETLHYDTETVETIVKAMPCWLPGMTPLMLAAALNNEPMVSFLLSNRANPNIAFTVANAFHDSGRNAIFVSEYEGFTALMFAIQNGNDTITDRLLKAGASPDHYAANGLNARSQAQKLNHETIIKKLSAYAASFHLQPIPIPKLVQAALPYRIHRHNSCIIVKLTHSKENVLFYIKPYGSYLLPFFNMPMKHYSSEKVLTSLHFFHQLEFNSSNVTLHDMGTFSIGIKENSCHFADQIIVLELDQELSRHFLKTGHPKAFFSAEQLKKLTDSKTCSEDVNKKFSTLSMEILNIIMTMHSIRPFSATELEQINQIYAKSLNSQAQLVEFAKQGNQKGVSEQLASVRNSADLDYFIPTPDKISNNDQNRYRCQVNHYPGYTNPLMSALANNQRLIMGCLIKAGARYDRLSHYEIAQAMIGNIDAKGFISIMDRHKEHQAQIYQADRIFDLIIEQDQLETFQCFAHYIFPTGLKKEFLETLIQESVSSSAVKILKFLLPMLSRETETIDKIFSLIIKKDKIEIFQSFADCLFPTGLKKELLEKLIKEAVDKSSIKIVKFLIPKVSRETVEACLVAAVVTYVRVTLYSCLYADNKKEIDNNIQMIAESLLPYCRPEQMASSNVIEKIISTGNQPLLKSILFFNKINKYQAVDPLKLQNYLESAIGYDKLAIFQYLLSECFFKNEIKEIADELLDYSAKNQKVDFLTVLIPMASEVGMRRAWRSALEADRVFKGERLILLSQTLQIFLTQFQPTAWDIGIALKVTFVSKDIKLFNQIKEAGAKITKEHKQYFIFAKETLVCKENSDFISSLLNSLVDPRGSWSLFVPIINGLARSKENFEFLENYFRNEYVKHAIGSSLSKIQKIIENDDSVALKNLIDSGVVDSNAFLFIPSHIDFINHNYYTFTTPIMMALKNKRYLCMKLLLDLGVELHDDGVYGNRENEINILTDNDWIDLVEKDQLEIIKSVLKINFEFVSFWRNLIIETGFSKMTSDIKQEKSDNQKFDLIKKDDKISGINKKETQDKLKKQDEILNKASLTIKFLRDRKQFIEDFNLAVMTLNLKKMEECIELIPQFILKRSFSRFLEKFISPHIGSIQLKEEGDRNSPDYGCIVPPRLSHGLVKKELQFMVGLFIQHIHIIPRENLLEVCTISRLLERNLMQKVRAVPSVSEENWCIWLDAIRYLDIDIMKFLLRQDTSERGVNLNLNAFPLINRFNIPESFAKTPFTLFLYACYSPHFYSPERQEKLLEVFKFMVINGADKSILEPQNPNDRNVGLWLQNCPHVQLRQGLELTLHNTCRNMRRAEKNWMTVGIVCNFLDANREDQRKYSILSLYPEILKLTGSKADLELCSFDSNQKLAKKGLLDTPYFNSLRKSFQSSQKSVPTNASALVLNDPNSKQAGPSGPSPQLALPSNQPETSTVASAAPSSTAKK